MVAPSAMAGPVIIMRQIGTTVAGLALIAYGVSLLRPGAQLRLFNLALRGWGFRRRIEPDSSYGRFILVSRGIFFLLFGSLVLLIGLGLA